MSKMLKSSDKSKLSSAMSKIISAAKGLEDMPHYSVRADKLVNDVRAAGNLAEKIKSELNPTTSQNPPDRPDSNQGDADNTKPKTPTTTDDRPANNGNGNGDQSGGDQSGRKFDADTSGFPEKRDGNERQGNDYNVDSNAHRAVARGDDRHVNADTLPGKSKKLGEGHAQRDTDGNPIEDQAEPTNISQPFKHDRDTTNTAEPDGTLGYFEKQAREFDDESKASDSKDDAERERVLTEKRDRAVQAASESKKYDSENRLSTEAHGHRALKAEQERAEAEQKAERDHRTERIEETIKAGAEQNDKAKTENDKAKQDAKQTDHKSQKHK